MNPGSEPHKKTHQSISQVVIPPRDINHNMKLDILKQCIGLLSMVHDELNLNSANREFFLKELYTLEWKGSLPNNISAIKNDLICILDIRQDCSWGEIIEYMETLSIYETWTEPNKLKSI